MRERRSLASHYTLTTANCRRSNDEVRLCWQSVMEVACGWSVVRRARRRAVSQGRCHVLCSASGDVSVPRIVQSGITATASPSTNAQVCTVTVAFVRQVVWLFPQNSVYPLVWCLLSCANQVKYLLIYNYSGWLCFCWYSVVLVLLCLFVYFLLFTTIFMVNKSYSIEVSLQPLVNTHITISHCRNGILCA